MSAEVAPWKLWPSLGRWRSFGDTSSEGGGRAVMGVPLPLYSRLAVLEGGRGGGERKEQGTRMGVTRGVTV